MRFGILKFSGRRKYYGSVEAPLRMLQSAMNGYVITISVEAVGMLEIIKKTDIKPAAEKRLPCKEDRLPHFDLLRIARYAAVP